MESITFRSCLDENEVKVALVVSSSQCKGLAAKVSQMQWYVDEFCYDHHDVNG